jgi:hypothetical protein
MRFQDNDNVIPFAKIDVGPETMVGFKEHYRFIQMVITHKLIHFLSESPGIRFQVSGFRFQVSGFSQFVSYP